MTAKKRLVRNIIFAILTVAILGGGYYFALKWEPGSTGQVEETFDPSLTYVVFENQGDVTSIDIKNQSEEYTILRSDKDGITSYSIPSSAYNLDSHTIGSTFSSLITTSAVRTVSEDASNPSEYGLGEGSIQFTITKSDNTRTTVLIGDEIPSGGEFYCMTSTGNKIYTVSSRTAQLVSKVISDYRPKGILVLAASTDISNFTLYHKGNLVVSFKETTQEEQDEMIVPTQWVIEKPWRSEVDAEKVITLFENFIDISATDFPSAEETPVFDYKLEISAKGQDYVFSIGNENQNGGVYLRNDKTSEMYIVGFQLRVAVMGIDPNLYTTKLVDLEKLGDISKITISSGKGEYTMSPGDFDICGEKVDEKTFKQTYQTVMSVGYIDRGDLTPSGNPYMTITFDLTDGSRKVTKYYPYGERNFIAQNSDGDTYLVLKAEVERVENLIK